MGYKAFADHCRSATACRFPNVSSIRRGEGDGQIDIAYRLDLPDVKVSLDISMSLSDVGDYPSRHQWFAYTTSDNVPNGVTAVLGSLTPRTDIETTITKLANSLTAKLTAPGADAETDADADGDCLMTDVDEEEEEDEEDDDDEEYEFDDCFAIQDGDMEAFVSPMPRLGANTVGLNNTSGKDCGLPRLKRDLLQVRQAGFLIGWLKGLNNESTMGLFSMSVRFSKLGLSSDTLDAWSISPDDYFVLLFNITDRYRPLEDSTQTRIATKLDGIEFKIGKCDSYKPSRQSAALAFESSQNLMVATDTGRGQAPATPPSAADTAFGPFQSLFLSSSLNHFLNNNFVSMVKVRCGHGTGTHVANTWDAAITYLDNLRCLAGPTPDGYSWLPPSGLASQTPLDDHLSGISTRRESSFPLVAMEFALHFLRRCTDYCLVCHKKLAGTFAALRPYVCDNSLCLFQYMNLDFGPSIEAEIVNHPLTVDLLTSCCYAGLAQRYNSGYYSNAPVLTAPNLPNAPGIASATGVVTAAGVPAFIGTSLNVPDVSRSTFLRELPTGLRFKVPMLCTYGEGSDKRDRSIAVKFHESPGSPGSLGGNAQILDPGAANDAGQILKPNQWVAILPRAKKTTFASTSSAYTPAAMSVARISVIYGVQVELQDYGSMTGIPAGMPVRLIPFDEEFDDLPHDVKIFTARWLLDCLPPVSSMRDFLLANPHRAISTMSTLTPAASTMLKWVVSSNRSFLSLVHPVTSVPKPGTTSVTTAGTSSTASPYPEPNPSLQRYFVDGMDRWLQFRFLQGSPEQESRFTEALETTKTVDKLYPTLFAWHGSDLRNWHSIMRHGLDFKDTTHGRAYGNGVYLSTACTMSMNYTGQLPSHQKDTWHNSDLQLSKALALCECINDPGQWVSRSPHYVINKVDWIQCRYLFVLPADDSRIAPAPVPVECRDLPIDQSPAGIVYNDKVTAPGPITIPRIAATPRSRPQSTEGSASETVKFLPDNDKESAEDHLFLLPEEDDNASGSGTNTPTQAHEFPVTPFTPGSIALGHHLIPQPPSYATDAAQRAIMRELKTLRTELATRPLPILGWHIDMSAVENMFQLIFELHSFDLSLPLARDLQSHNMSSVVLEFRFGQHFPISPPFVRVVRPRFLPFMQGGGGHITIGGAICMELLTNSGWSPACGLESVLVQVRAAICSVEDGRPARLDPKAWNQDYGAAEAFDAYERFARTHGWEVSGDVGGMKADSRRY